MALEHERSPELPTECLPYGEDRHCLFSSRCRDPATALGSSCASLSVPVSGNRAKSSQAIVVLCSAAKGDEDGGPRPPTTPGGGIAPAGGAEGDRWCSWADAKPGLREKLVEEQLARTHKEYCRLFQYHGGASRAARNEAGKETPCCRACFDPMLDYLILVTASTRRLTTERVVFHYMHHHAPSLAALRDEGKLLVYDHDSNEHRPLPLQAVHEQLKAPAVYAFDCPHAGRLIDALNNLVPADADVIALGTCGGAQELPWGKLGLPADLFTSCLMAPVRAALSFYRVQNEAVFPLPLDALRLVTGKPQDRGSPLGELVSVFTAIADAIAWSAFEPSVFWRLFREDGALAELCRNFLLATRILHAFRLKACSRPPLPPTHGHHLWEVWDSTLELFLVRLARGQCPSPARPLGGQSEPPPEQRAVFFDEQMAAFSIWLRFQSASGTEGAESSLERMTEPPAELPVMLQGLLHPSCRLQALILLGYFVDLGLWAVNLALMVGVRPYLTKLLQHDDADRAALEGTLVVWAKILASTDEGPPGNRTYANFCRLVSSERLSAYHRALACVCLATACRGRRGEEAQLGCLELQVLETCAGLLQRVRLAPPLRWMAALLCAEVCRGCPRAARQALQDGHSLAEALLASLDDACPEVRASCAYAIGRILEASRHRQEDDEQSQPSRVEEEHAGWGTAPRTGILDSLRAARPEPPALQLNERRLWLARGAMCRFCREPLAGSTSPPGPVPGSHGQADGALLNEASTLVRYELLCALAPWLAELSAGSPAMGVERGPSVGSLAALSYLPPSAEAAGDDSCSLSSASAPGTPKSHTPSRSPHLRPNSSMCAVPVVEAHQARRRFMHLLAQDPLLPDVPGGSSSSGAAPPSCSRSPLVTHQSMPPADGEGDATKSWRPIRKVVSESSLARLKQGMPDEETSASVPFPEPVVYAWTISFLQKPNALAQLKRTARPAHDDVVDLAGLGRLSEGARCAACGTLPQCPWGLRFPAGEQDGARAACGCRLVTLPAMPCPPFTTPPPAQQGGAEPSAGHGAGPEAPAQPPCPALPGDEGGSAASARGSRKEAERVQLDRLEEAPQLDVKLPGLLQHCGFHVGERTEPLGADAVCLRPALAACVVRGRHGQLAAVRFEEGSEPKVTGFNIHALEQAGRAPPPPGQRVGSREDDVTHLALINEHAAWPSDLRRCLLCCATDDGTVHVCRCWGCDHDEPDVVCTFQALPRRQHAALCAHWQQRSAWLLAAGRDPCLRIWDLNREQLIMSFKHNRQHRVTCVTQGGAALGAMEAPEVAAGLVFAGCGDGSLVAVDARARRGVVQCHMSQLSSVATITPGVAVDGGSASAVASSDSRGVVDLWDVRTGGSLACYHLGLSASAAEGAAPSLSEDASFLAHACEESGLIASVRLAGAPPHAVVVTDLASGERQQRLQLHKDTRPAAVGFRPAPAGGRAALGVLCAEGDGDARLLLFGSAPRRAAADRR